MNRHNPFGHVNKRQRRIRRGDWVRNQNDKKWKDALKQLDQLDQLNQQVNVLQMERDREQKTKDKLRDAEQKKSAEEEARKLEEMRDIKLARLVADAIIVQRERDDHTKKEELKRIEDATKGKAAAEAVKEAKKPWYKRVFNWQY